MLLVALLLGFVAFLTQADRVDPSLEMPVAAHVGAAQTTAQRHVVRHLDGALRLLDRRDLSRLTPEQRQRRAAAIDALRAYRDAGRFPVNRDFPGERVPYFIDPATDVHCAVGHLMAVTGYEALARRIAAADNHVRVLELQGDAEVGAWLEAHGLTLEEAARIQPSYEPIEPPVPVIPRPNPPGFPYDFPPGDNVEQIVDATALGGALGASGVLLLTQHLTSVGRGSRVLPAANLIVGFTTVALAVVSNESSGLRAATGGVGLASALSGISALQGGAASRMSSRRVQWRISPTRSGRALYAGVNWRF